MSGLASQEYSFGLPMNPFAPHPVSHPNAASSLVGRSEELEQVSEILRSDGDLVLTGVPGVGRRTLIRVAARRVGAKVVEIDCLRATDDQKFLRLLADGILAAFQSPRELSLIQAWVERHGLVLDMSATGKAKVLWQFSQGQEWPLFQVLLALPQALAEALDCRVVLVFQSFPHIRSWDRSGKWEYHLRQEIQMQTRVSYAIVATVAENWGQQPDMETVRLAPVPDTAMRSWLMSTMAQVELRLDPAAIQLFLETVQGHFGDGIALAKRIWLDHRNGVTVQVRSHQVYRSSVSLMEDLSVTFESLVLLLPNTQVRVLESLALDPTDRPHAKEYIVKHQLSRGGTLQGALSSLENKGLIYGPELGYRIALPMLGVWLKHRLS